MLFRIDGQPKGKGRPRFTKTGHAYTPGETLNYENLIAWEYKQAGGKLFDSGYILICIDAFYRIPKSITKAKRAMIEKGVLRPAVKPDIDNVTKAILDALNGVAYRDDTQVVFVSAMKHYSDEPCVMVKIEREEDPCGK